MGKAVDLTHFVFGRLTVIGLAQPYKWGRRWRCKCECGNTKIVSGLNLRNGHIRSCGCLRKQNIANIGRTLNVKHGLFGTPEWYAYMSAKTRCTNPNDRNYPDYGGRGIEFKFNSITEFYKELGPRPKGLVLDRRNNDGHYEPGNVRWITYSESNRNRRRKRKA